MEFTLNNKTYLVNVHSDDTLRKLRNENRSRDLIEVYQLKTDGEVNWNRGRLDARRAPEAYAMGIKLGQELVNSD